MQRTTMKSRERQKNASTTNRSTASQKLQLSRDRIEATVDHNFEVAASGAAVSHVGAWDLFNTDSVGDEDTTLESVRQWIAARIAARIAALRVVGALILSESRGTRADTAKNQVTGIAIALTG